MEENRSSIKKSSLNKTWLLVAGLVILTVVLLVISLNSKNFPGLPSSSKDIKTDFAYTSLVISEETRASTVLGTYEVNININTDKNEVTGAQLELTFDPKILTKVDIRAGNFLNDPTILIKDIDTKNGRLTFALGNRPGEKAVKGSGTIAILSFSKASLAETSVNFLPHTTVSAPGHNQSVLKKTVSAVIGPLPTPTGKTQPFVSPIPTK